MGESADIIRFEGHLDSEQIDRLLMSLEDKLQGRVLPLITKKRIYSASVECLDNIFKHADVEDIPQKHYEQYPSLYRLSQIEGIYRLEVSNVILNTEVGMIREKLEQLNGLDREGINQLFKDTISQTDGLSDKGGAGLGLIVLAKTTHQPIRYHFKPIGKGHSYFTLIIYIE
ncbi:MAG TPA: SiaB family protein kinase [Bacteroidales bacterium]|nr:SiaB family protein kinase [Bacteroidales bacterium]